MGREFVCRLAGRLSLAVSPLIHHPLDDLASHKMRSIRLDDGDKTQVGARTHYSKDRTTPSTRLCEGDSSAVVGYRFP